MPEPALLLQLGDHAVHLPNRQASLRPPIFRHQRFRDLVFGPAAEQARGRLPSSNRTRKRSTSESFKPIRKLTRHGLKTLCFEATSTPSTRRLNAADSAPRGILIKPPKFGGQMG